MQTTAQRLLSSTLHNNPSAYVDEVRIAEQEVHIPSSRNDYTWLQPLEIIKDNYPRHMGGWRLLLGCKTRRHLKVIREYSTDPYGYINNPGDIFLGYDPFSHHEDIELMVAGKLSFPA